MSAVIRRRFALVGLPGLLVAATAALLLAARPDLPEQVAVHFGPDGTADGFASADLLLPLIVGIEVAMWALMSTMAVWAGRQMAGGRAMLAGSAGIVGFLGTLGVSTAWAQRGLDTAVGVSPDLGGTLLAATGVAIVSGGLGVMLAPPATDAPTATGAAPAEAPREDLGGGAGVWRGRTRAGPGLVVLTAVMILTSTVVVVLAEPVLGLVALLPMIAVLASLRFTVTIGPGGVVVRGLIGWPRTHVPLSVVAGADVRSVRPFAEYGGWGWRMRRNRTGIVTSAGPALVVNRSDGAALVVTVEDPRRAAGMVNTLVDRRHDPQEHRRAADSA